MVQFNTKTLLIFFIFTSNVSFAQKDTINISDNPRKNHTWAYVGASALISYGIITRLSSELQDFDHRIDKQIVQNIHRKYVFDDYIQYAPYLGIYAPDLFDVKKVKHNCLDRSLVLASSILFCSGAIQITKHTSNVSRPNGFNNHSFPSGHTATAFLGAHILFREYENVSPYIGIAGYAIAATTGTMRMINRQHWFSDVLTGAGIGILSVELSYLMLPVWHKLFEPLRLSNNLVISPFYNESGVGIGGVMYF
jgi:hypothetical protein